jgi:hypothetical protein
MLKNNDQKLYIGRLFGYTLSRGGIIMRIAHFGLIGITIFLMGMSKNPDNFEKTASISVETDGCLYEKGNNKIKIRFINKSKNDCWVNTWTVRVILENEGGNPVKQIRKIEKGTPDRERFKLLKGSDSIEIIEEENFSEDYEISSTGKYQIVGFYDDTLEQDNTRLKTLIGYAYSRPAIFRFCQ